MKQQLITTFVYGQNQTEAIANFRKTTPGYTPISAKYAGTKHGAKVYQIIYRKKIR